VANSGSGDVTVLLSTGPDANGAPTFAPPVTYPLATGQSGAVSLISGHFHKDPSNNDKLLDLAVANYTSDDVSLLLNNGDGTFQAAKEVGLNGPDGAQSITAADFNGDHVLDLAVANYSTDDVSVLLNDGNGNFTAHEVGLNGPDGAEGIASGDFNGDGLADLAVANNDGTVSILLNNGGAIPTFTPRKPDLQFSEPNAGIVTADFNGDGKADLAVFSFVAIEPFGQHRPWNFSGTVTVLLGQGDGTFPTVTSYPAFAWHPSQYPPVLGPIAVRDFNGDGLPDLVVGAGSRDIPTFSSSPSVVKVFLNQGNGTFFPAVDYSVDDLPQGITTGAFNGDGVNDIAVTTASNDVNILYAGTVGNFATFLPDKASQPTSLATLLAQMQTLQGGKAVKVGPYDSTSQITPSTSTPPDYLADIGLAYYPGSAPLSVVSPGWFLSATPATISEMASGYSYTGTGNLITGWDLYDANNHPIALATAQQLFGTPVLNQLGDSRPFNGVDLTPIDPQHPIVGLNGGWYFGVRPITDAPTTWADAFFAWGMGTDGYSPRNLVPNYLASSGTGTQTGTLPGSSESFSTDFKYTVTIRPAPGAPPMP
jgi:hypothetical protein